MSKPPVWRPCSGCHVWRVWCFHRRGFLALGYINQRFFWKTILIACNSQGQTKGNAKTVLPKNIDPPDCAAGSMKTPMGSRVRLSDRLGRVTKMRPDAHLYTPRKLTAGTPKWRFGSDEFPFQRLIFWFQPLVFGGSSLNL